MAGCAVLLMVVWGARDRILPPPDGEIGRMVRIDDAGHMPQMETTSAVTAALEEQLAG